VDSIDKPEQPLSFLSHNALTDARHIVDKGLAEKAPISRLNQPLNT
jgi:hypothetical protein